MLSSEARAEKLRERLHRDGAMTGKAKNKAKRALRRASRASSKTRARPDPAATSSGQRAPLIPPRRATPSRSCEEDADHHRTQVKEGINGSFAAIHLLYDPQSIAEKLLAQLRKSTDR